MGDDSSIESGGGGFQAECNSASGVANGEYTDCGPVKPATHGNPAVRLLIDKYGYSPQTAFLYVALKS